MMKVLMPLMLVAMLGLARADETDPRTCEEMASFINKLAVGATFCGLPPPDSTDLNSPAWLYVFIMKSCDADIVKQGKIFGESSFLHDLDTLGRAKVCEKIKTELVR
jgi:hypothetical protein